MKRIALALAALFALSSAAFAGEAVRKAPTSAACAATTLKAKLDCEATGSVEKTRTADTSKEKAEGPRLGIDIDPWIMPAF